MSAFSAGVGGGALGGSYVEFGGRDTGWSRELNRARSGLDGLKAAGAGVAGTFASLGALATRFAAPVAAIFGIGSVGAGVTRAVSLAAEFEQTTVAFEVMLGSADRARALLGDLESFAVRTPFKLDDIVAASRQLLNANVAAEDMVSTLTMLGDIAAGTGSSMVDLAAIFARVRANGRASMEEINRLADRGVPIYAALAQVLGVTNAEVRKLVSDGAVGAEEMEAAIRSLAGEGGKFHGLMQRQSETTAGRWSSLQDSIDATLRKSGEWIIGTFRVNEAIAVMTERVDSFRETVFGAGESSQAVIARLAGYVGTVLPEVVASIGDGVTAMGRLVLAVADEVGGYVDRTIARVVAAVRAGVVAIGSAIAGGITAAVTTTLDVVLSSASTIGKVVSALASGNFGAAAGAFAGGVAGNASRLAAGAGSAAADAVRAAFGVGKAGDAFGREQGADTLGTLGAIEARTDEVMRGLATRVGLASIGWGGLAGLGAAGGAGGLGGGPGGPGGPGAGTAAPGMGGGAFTGLREGFDAIQRAVFGSDPNRQTADATRRTAVATEKQVAIGERILEAVGEAADAVRGGPRYG
jgi:tape measure domain-containing protein